jgi:hypothetical protein
MPCRRPPGPFYRARLLQGVTGRGRTCAGAPRAVLPCKPEKEPHASLRPRLTLVQLRRPLQPRCSPVWSWPASRRARGRNCPGRRTATRTRSRQPSEPSSGPEASGAEKCPEWVTASGAYPQGPPSALWLPVVSAAEGGGVMMPLGNFEVIRVVHYGYSRKELRCTVGERQSPPEWPAEERASPSRPCGAGLTPGSAGYHSGLSRTRWRTRPAAARQAARGHVRRKADGGRRRTPVFRVRTSQRRGAAAWL